MWQRFSERARRVVFFAQEEAARLEENYVSTEHLLLGMVREDDSVAVRILGRLRVSPEGVRSEIERQVTRGDGRMGQDMQLTPRAKRVIDLAYDEARQLHNNYIGTEHLLLGLIREGEGIAGRVLSKLGIDLERTRAEIRKLQDQEPAASSASDTTHPGDLGTLHADEGSSRCQVFRLLPGTDEAEIRQVLETRDAFGYRDLVRQGVILWIDEGTPAKLLRLGGRFLENVEVRLLDGKHAGKAVWVPASRWERTGPDESPFPPDISDLLGGDAGP